MGIEFPSGSISVTTTTGDTVILRICDLCGATVIDAEDTDLAFHKRWHRMTGSGNWVDPATGTAHGPGSLPR
ncbi:histidine ammonia-lyase [Microbacterium foliorum]|uniref:histidine ammonia-lyase n=1 Tax=Microbacterium foliorum TaxID=104336 RepID=UPI001DF018DA|nr:histidine ammonia-lyase [Microbacterium foliorum]CAH0195716.1 hypothetical protein SRABI03_01851 [Microbacterium foliorum]CAH0232903.1 hypothetical protein SRABI44_02713 [Microbacterium foliorum]